MSDLFAPLSLARGPAMKNRFMLAPLTNRQSHSDGKVSDLDCHWLSMRASGGFGLTMTCGAYVLQNGQGFGEQLGIWSDDHVPGLKRLADEIRAAGSLSSVQLHHAGFRAGRDLIGEAPVGPIADAETGARAMTTAEVEEAVVAYAAAARRAELAGFDGVELHSAHGYLICAFLATNNDRDDGWGGSFAERRRFLDTIIAAVRDATGPNFQLGVRLSPERHSIDTREALELAQSLMTSGVVDYVDMSLWSCFETPVDPAFAEKPLIEWFSALPRGNCRLGVAGKIMSAADVRKCIDAGADFVLLGRGGILHHDFPNLVKADPNFTSKEMPVSREYLAGEGLGEPFIDYISAFPGFVEGGAPGSR